MGGAALADTERLEHAVCEVRLRRNERDHEAEQANALDVFLDEDSVHRPVCEIHDAHQRAVIDEWKADERTRGEELVANERMMLCFGHILHEERLSRCRHLACDTLTKQ